MAETSNPVARLNELIRGVEFAMLTTVRPNGNLHSCPMASQGVDSDGVLWFLSDNNTQKVQAIKSNPRVNLAYSDSLTQRYVSVTGRSELVRDHVKAKQLWNSLYQNWFPKGLEDPELILLKVHILDVEYWDGSAGRMLHLTGFAI